MIKLINSFFIFLLKFILVSVAIGLQRLSCSSTVPLIILVFFFLLVALKYKTSILSTFFALMVYDSYNDLTIGFTGLVYAVLITALQKKQKNGYLTSRSFSFLIFVSFGFLYEFIFSLSKNTLVNGTNILFSLVTVFSLYIITRHKLDQVLESRF